jgi:TolB-like protein/tetratricopeptide (TPR) repeat protein
VLPFQNAGTDASLDFLSLALPDEIATILSHTRSVSVRPFATTSKYNKPDLDVQQAGREMRAATVVTGHFLGAGDVVRITLEAVDVETNRSLWRDVLDAPAHNMIATQAQIGLRIRGGLASVFGWSASNAAAQPKDEEAYGLFLRSAVVAASPVANTEGIRMLERSVELDPAYPPAWLALARRYYVESRYANGNATAFARYEAAMERSLALDPEYVAPAAGLVIGRVEQGHLVKAHATAANLVRRRPDSIDAQFALSYVLRYAGLLDEAASHCDTAFLLDPRTQTSGLRSCAVVFVLRGNYQRAMNYVDLDYGSDWAKAISIHMLVRDGKTQEALKLGSPHIPQWNSYDMLLACVQHSPPPEILALAAAVKPLDDPETNYFSAAHLAYCGQSRAALEMLKEAIQGKYCSFPAIDSDPYFTGLRSHAAFAEVRSAAMSCQREFLADRGQGSP